MAAEAVTPIDKNSGLPLPIAPTECSLPISDGMVANWHHHFHPSTHETLQYPDLEDKLRVLGGRALRHCRMQLVAVQDHNYGLQSYHNYFKGPPLPTEPKEQFEQVVFACSGYIPDQAIDIRSGEFKVINLNRNQKNVLHQTKYTKDYRNFRYGYEPIRDYFKEYAFSQDISSLDELAIEEFLLTQDVNRRKFLGHLLLAKVIEIATDSVDEKYKKYKKTGYLHPMMPSRSYSLVKARMGSPKKREELFPAIKYLFADYFGVETSN
jgi:hypothetical protein